MNYRKLYALLTATLGLLCSCSITGLTDGYNRLKPEDKQTVAYASRGEDLTRANVKMISGRQLLAELPSEGYSLVYYYIPGCRGEQCQSYELLNERVKAKLKLFVVVRNVDTDNIIERAKRLPLYGMDRYYYGTKYGFKLEPRFFGELTGRSVEEMKREGNLAYLFKGKEYLRSVNIKELDALLAELP